MQQNTAVNALMLINISVDRYMKSKITTTQSSLSKLQLYKQVATPTINRNLTSFFYIRPRRHRRKRLAHSDSKLA